MPYSRLIFDKNRLHTENQYLYMAKFLFLLFFPAVFSICSGQTIAGIVSADNHALGGVQVLNVRSGSQTLSDTTGQFTIRAMPGDELRFVKNSYYRASKIITVEDTAGKIVVDMTAQEIHIPEVEIAFRPTGNLAKDNAALRTGWKTTLNKGMSAYIRQPSSRTVTAPRAGEFVQPKGPGFEITKIGYKWDIYDFMKFLEDSIPDYIAALGVADTERDAFVLFVLKDFEKKNILRYGYCSPADLMAFKLSAEKKLPEFRKAKLR